MFISFLYFLAVYDRIKRLRENPEFKTTLGINLGKNKTSKVLSLGKRFYNRHPPL